MNDHSSNAEHPASCHAPLQNQQQEHEVYYEEVLSAAGVALSLSKSTSNDAGVQRNANNTSILDDISYSSSSSGGSSPPSTYASSAILSQNPYTNNDLQQSDTSFQNISKEEAELLASLPQRPIANFPSEGDRKRIIGMLATIISMIYQYEDQDYLDYSPSNVELADGTSQNNTADEDAIYNQVDGFNSDIGKDVTSSSSSKSDADAIHEIQQMKEVQKSELFRKNQLQQDFIDDCDSFEELWERTSPGKSTKQVDTSRDDDNNKTNAKTNQSGRKPVQKQDSSLNAANNSSRRISPQKQSTQAKKEYGRYRRRRHQVYSEFLVMAADLLFLDKSNAIAFLPLLNVLLGNETVSSSSKLGAEYEYNDIDSNTGSRYSVHSSSGNSTNSQKQTWDSNDILLPFLESLEPGVGVQCLSLLLLNYLLKSVHGYDSRIRACIKKLGVVIFTHELKISECEDVAYRLQNRKGISIDDCLSLMATRKFESLEHAIASKLLRISAAQQQKEMQNQRQLSKKSVEPSSKGFKGKVTRAQILRGLKIGTAGVAAGTILGLTGGLAAPAIAAGITATGLTTAATAGVVTTLTSTAAVTTIFGVGGGGLAAYKTHRRTKGVTEFVFQKQVYKQNETTANGFEEEKGNAELFTTICISGWLKDNKDFERPWGVDPVNPPITDRLEKLARFYSIHKPENIVRCQEILRRWKGEERELWAILREKYGQDPDHIYPILESPHRRIVITHEEDELIDSLLGELGYQVPPSQGEHGPLYKLKQQMFVKNDMDSNLSMRSNTGTNEDTNTSFSSTTSEKDKNDRGLKYRSLTAWDYQMEYGGELLTVKWESDMLVELNDSVADMAADLAGQAAREVLKQTALATLITAVALPYAIVRATEMIDGIWTLAIERADAAGIELAHSLLESEAGNRPVVLVGYSMGARTIYSCLKELGRQQQKWEDEQQELLQEKKAKKRGIRKGLGKSMNKNPPKNRINREPASIVEDAIMMGLPNHLSLHSWESCRRIVAGRLVNCYSKNDMILSLMFQIKRLTGVLRPVCGTSAVKIRGVENYNVASLISAHSDYCSAAGHILRMIYHGCPHRRNASIVVPGDSATSSSYVVKS